MSSRLISFAIFAAVLSAYYLTMRLAGDAQSGDVSYFHQLAGAFVHGHTSLSDPAATVDLARFEGRWYVPFPPLPALLMTPAVAIVGTQGLNVAVFVAVMGAAAMAILFRIFDMLSVLGWTRLTRSANLLLTVAFAFGSIHWYMATTSSVWFVAQVTTFLFVLVALLSALHGTAPILTGCALALAVTGRPHAVMILPLLFAVARQRGDRPPFGLALQLLIPLAVAGLGLAAYNYARFGNPTDFGYSYSLGGGQPEYDFRTYGQFNFRYVARNIFAMFIEWPHWNPRVGFFMPDQNGMSVFLAMPFIVWAALARQPRSVVRAAWIAVLAGLCLPLTYYMTGWVQFGPRFALDVMPALALLIALGVRDGTSPRFVAVVALSVLINAGGTVWWHWPRSG